MKLQIHFFGVNAHPRTFQMLEPELARLQRQTTIESAAVVLEYTRDGGVPFGVRVHLAVAGPDIHAEARDHTLAAAWHKVCANLEEQIEQRKAKQLLRVKSNRQQSGVKRGWFRPAMAR